MALDKLKQASKEQDIHDRKIFKKMTVEILEKKLLKTVKEVTDICI